MNDIRDVVAIVDEAGTTIEWAVVLAQEHGAHLIGVFLCPPFVGCAMDAYVRGAAIRHMLEEHAAERASLEQRQRACSNARQSTRDSKRSGASSNTKPWKKASLRHAMPISRSSRVPTRWDEETGP